jgi:nucleoid-associated protein YgaU
LVEHARHHKVPFSVNPPALADTGDVGRTEEIMDGMDKIRAVAALVESTIIWRAQHIAWNVDIFKAESLLFRLIFKEGVQNPQAMDLLARIYFQQGKYEKAKDLWNKATELQPGNPALKRTAGAMQSIAKSPTSALKLYQLVVMVRGILIAVLLCAAGLGGAKGYDAISRWAAGPVAVQNLTGRFHYEYVSITDGMVYVPSPATVAAATDDIVPVGYGGGDERYSVGFNRVKAASGRVMGRIEVVVERTGGTLKASGNIPDLNVRYMVEQALWEIPGVTEVDIRGLVVDRTYRVNRGDSLWIIARKVYGQGSSWTLLAKANDLSNPNSLRIGQKLSLPLGDEILTHIN